MALMRKYRTLLWKNRALLQREWPLGGYQVAEGPKMQRDSISGIYGCVAETYGSNAEI